MKGPARTPGIVQADIGGRIPADFAAERALLGDIIVGGSEYFTTAAALVSEEDFLSPTSRRVFAALARLSARGLGGPDFLRQELAERSELEACGGPGYIGQLMDAATPALVKPHMHAVKQAAERRTRWSKAEEQRRAAQEEGPTAVDDTEPTGCPIGLDFSGPIARDLQTVGLIALPRKPPLDEVEKCLRKLREELPARDTLRREVVQQATAQHLANLGVVGAKRLVDAAFGGNAKDDLQGEALEFEETEAWPDAIDTAALLNRIQGTITRFIVLPPGGAVVATLWVVHSWALDAFNVSPYLFLKSRTRREGKTRTLVVLKHLTPRPVMASRISAAALMRSAQRHRPTFLLDELHRSLPKNETLALLLDAGHVRDDAVAIVCEGENHEQRAFRVFGPKVLAAIGNLPDTIEDRSIVMPMARKRREQQVHRLREGKIDCEFADLRRMCARWAADNLSRLAEADPDLPGGLDDRAKDLWSPLIAIADLAGGAWAGEARRAATTLSGSRDEGDQTPRMLLLKHLKEIFSRLQADRLTTEEILAQLHARQDGPWAEWRSGKPLSPVQFSRLLRPFGVGPRDTRTPTGVKKGYFAHDLGECFAIYVPPEAEVSEPRHPRQSASDAGSLPESDPRHGPDVAAVEIPATSRKMGVVADVALPGSILPRVDVAPVTASDIEAGVVSIEPLTKEDEPNRGEE